MKNQENLTKLENKPVGRIFIYPKDIALLTGKSYSAGLAKFQEIKQALKKVEHQGLTLKEYAEYEGIEVAIVQAAIK